VAPLIRRLQILGATGVVGPELDRIFDEVEAIWRGPNDGVAPMPSLMSSHAPLVAPALAAAPEALIRWRAVALLDAPLWAAIDRSDSAREGALATALRGEELEERTPSQLFLLGAAALDLGDAAQAHRLFSRLDSLALALDRRDVGWGLRALSWYHRGRALEEMADTVGAESAYRRFLETRATSDEVLPFALEARSRVQLFGGGG
jgi:hypothetical protein